MKRNRVGNIEEDRLSTDSSGKASAAAPKPVVICLGHASFDVTMAVDHHPLPDEKMRASAIVFSGGGPAANASVAVARLGGHAFFCGRLGKDAFGESHLQELKAEGVDTRLVVRSSALTSISQVLAKPDGTRSVVNYRVPKAHIHPKDIDERLLNDIQPHVVLFDGHEPNLHAMFLRLAQRNGALTILDAGSVHEGTLDLYRKVDVLAASQRFALELTGCATPESALGQLREATPCVVITCGSSGLLWAKNGQQGRLRAYEVDAVDTTGAGDAFHGALAFCLGRGDGWMKALRFASAAAALACTRLGARQGLPRLHSVTSLIA